MTYKVNIAPTAQAEMDAFAVYAANYSDDFAAEQFSRLNQILMTDLAQSPNMWGYFYITGAPYRAYLFRVGCRTQFWIVYTVNDMFQTVSVLRFWSARQDNAQFEIQPRRPFRRGFSTQHADLGELISSQADRFPI